MLDCTGFYQTLKTWDDLYNNLSEPKVRDERDMWLYDKWKLGLLRVVSSLYLIEELKNSPVEKHMLKAIEMSKNMDMDKASEIHLYISEVTGYLKSKVKK